MKNLIKSIGIKIKLELLWWIGVLGISDLNIFQPSRVQSLKLDLYNLFSCFYIAFIISCAVQFFIYTCLKNTDDAIFWWTLGVGSAMSFLVLGNYPYKIKK